MGFPLSNRCQYCARRKIKCDEKWPTCSNCKSRDRICSGPPDDRFVHIQFQEPTQACYNLCGQKVTDDPRQLSRPSTRSLSPFQHKIKGSRYSNSFINVSSRSNNGTKATLWKKRDPKLSISPLLQNCADNAVWKLITVALNMEDVNLYASLSKKSYSLLPRYMRSSTALCDAVTLMIETYSNHQRGLPAQKLIDRKAYGQALRSLNQGLQSSQKQQNSALLAAVSIIHRVVATYEAEPEHNPSVHLRGIYAIMTACGPPQLDDELGLSLALDNIGTLYMDSLVSSKPNLYNRPEWQRAVQTALSSGIIENETKADIYRLALRTSNWPSLFRRLDDMQQIDDCESSGNAFIVAKTATEEMNLIQRLGELCFASMRNHGKVTEHPDRASPFLVCYTFAEPLIAMLFVLYAMARIAIGYAVKHVLALNGTHRPDIATEISEMSFRIGRCIKYARQFKPLKGCYNQKCTY
ncbi:hypothetical protein J3E69DRAFT_360576 [Trichoderma sp. SZMC 28015]